MRGLFSGPEGEAVPSIGHAQSMELLGGTGGKEAPSHCHPKALHRCQLAQGHPEEPARVSPRHGWDEARPSDGMCFRVACVEVAEEKCRSCLLVPGRVGK